MLFVGFHSGLIRDVDVVNPSLVLDLEKAPRGPSGIEILAPAKQLSTRSSSFDDSLGVQPMREVIHLQ